MNGAAGRASSARMLLLVLALLALAHVGAWTSTEPFYNNDETRHVMTGVFFRDLLHDHAFTHARSYAERYYVQYPALGLLIWPPFFHMVEGLAMLIFGISFTVSRLLTLGFGLLACFYCFRIVESTHGSGRAAWAALFLGVMPLVFVLSTRAMLEVPALALFLAATWHWMRYLEDSRGTDLAATAAAAALCALTRYDAVVIAPFLALLAASRGRAVVLARPKVILLALGTACVVAPVFYLAWKEIGWLHQASITGGLPGSNLPLLSWPRLAFYFRKLPTQAGPLVVVAGVAGLIRSLGAARRRTAAPYLLLAGFTWLAFTPISEMEPRHVVFWLPAWAFFAAEGVAAFPGMLGPSVAAALLLAQGFTTVRDPARYVRGYAQAARFVLDESRGSNACIFDGDLEGDFIYQVRRLDPARRLSVVRADRLLYEALDQLPAAYRERVSTDSAVVARITAVAPRWIVVEDQRIDLDVPMALRLRAVLESHKECFHRVRTVTLDSNQRHFRGHELWIYENSCRGGSSGAPTELDVPELRHPVGAAPVGKD